jgi:predicted flap endonuclease-1-like 5' DNA nuclease
MEELEELEPIDEGEISAVAPAPPRTSIPPPIPKQALERTLVGERRSPLLADGRVSGPPARLSLPPAPPPVGATPSSAPPSSGIYRIPETKTEIDRWKDVVRELELKVRLRDDLISELKRSLEEHKKLVAAAEARVASSEARVAASEARSAAAEARANAVEERVAAAEQRAASAEQRAAGVPAAALDDLKRIKGIGPAFERKLRTLGVNSYADVAGWTEADIERISEALAILPQRIARDGWIESARELLAK